MTTEKTLSSHRRQCLSGTSISVFHVRSATAESAVISRPAYSLYGICGSRNYRRFGRRATDVKTGNAGPKLHWLVWERISFLALPLDTYFLAENKGHDGDIWAEIKLFLAYCLFIRPILK